MKAGDACRPSPRLSPLALLVMSARFQAAAATAAGPFGKALVGVADVLHRTGLEGQAGRGPQFGPCP